LPPVYEATFAKGMGEWVIYWVSDGTSTWRIDYVYPLSEWEERAPTFEKVIASLETGPDRRRWGADIVRASGEEGSVSPSLEHYFLSEPAAGTLVPGRSSFPVGFSLQSKVFTDDYNEYEYLHRRFGSHIEVLEDKRASYDEALAEYGPAGALEAQYDLQGIVVHDMNGTAIAWYAGEDGTSITSVTLLLDKNGHLLKVVRDAIPDEELTIAQAVAEVETFSAKTP